MRPAQPGELGAELAQLIEEHVQRAERAPHSAEAHGTLGLVYEANRMWPEALACFEQTSTLDEQDPVWPAHQAKMLQRLGHEPRALEVLESAARRFPDHAPLQHQYGDALFEAGDLDRARPAFQRTMRLDRKRPEGFIGLGTVQLALGEGPAAVGTLERAVRKAPEDRRAHYVLGLAYRDVGRDAEAHLELRRGLDSRKSFLPDRGTLRLPEYVRGFERLLERGIRLTDTSPSEAVAVLGECRELQPENPLVLVNLGVALQRLGQHARAQDVLLEADRTSPDLHMVQVNLAACLLALQRPEEALARADHAVALAPGLARAHTLRGRALLALDRGAEGYPALVESARLEPDDPSVHEELGELCLEQGRSEQALVHYRQLCALLPESWEAQAQLVRAAVLGGDLPTARAALEHAQALAPAEPQLAAMAEALAALEAQEE